MKRLENKPIKGRHETTNSRLTSALLAVSLLFALTLTACGTPAAENSTPPTAPPAQGSQALETDKPTPAETAGTSEDAPSETPAASGSNILVVWFSRVGITPFADGADAESSASINLRDGELVGGLAVRDSAVSGAQADVQEWLNGLNLTLTI